MDRISRLLTLPLISVHILTTACQSQEKDNAPVYKDYVPRYVNLLPALDYPEQVYFLDLDYCPRGLEDLTKLEYLYFGPCYVGESVMNEIKKAETVDEIVFYKCNIDKLEFSDKQYEDLKFLSLPMSKLSNVDESVENISKFKSIETLGFGITNIPFFYEKWNILEKLKEVRCGNNIEVFDFETSFENLSLLPSLEKLTISSSDIKTFPSNFNKLNKLNYIYIYNCKNLNLDSTLNETKKWKDLEIIALADMGFKELPQLILEHKQLKSIDLSENESLDLEQALDVLSKIEGLEELNLSYCFRLSEEEMIMGGFDKLAELKNLKKFDFTRNQFVDSKYFWGLLGQLENLEELILANFPAQIFPDIHKLNNLRILDIRNTGPRNMENIEKFPSSVSTLKYSGSLLDDFPMEIINSPNLESVNLNNNDILVVPDEISEMKNLFHLDLGYNKLTELPESIKELKGNLKYLNLMGNPLNDNAETCEQIKKWLPNTEIFWGE